jgi:hypothetical protein
MKSMLLICPDEQASISAEREQPYEELTQLIHQFKANGQYLSVNPLKSVAAATSVRLRDSKRLVTDGPFAETHEQLGG